MIQITHKIIRKLLQQKKSTSKSKSDSSSKSSYQKTSYASEDDVFVINPKTGKKRVWSSSSKLCNRKRLFI